MIDMHAHILPGVDDGPATVAESLEMARMAVEDGIRVMVAAPHCLNELYSNSRVEILSACDYLRSVLEKNDIPLTLVPASEVHLNVEIIDEIKKGRLMTINDQEKHIFLELPGQLMVQGTIGFILRLRRMGVTPIITHPERNPAIQQDVGLLSDLISAGALSQITADSLKGGFGRHVVRCCKRIIRQNMVHFIASDAHSTRSRPPRLSAGVKKLGSLVDEEVLERITVGNPGMVLGESRE